VRNNVTDSTPTAPPPPAPAGYPSLHPECPDVARLGPNPVEGTLRAAAARVEAERAERAEAWSGGFTRRRFLQGVGMAGVASLGTQLVTTRASYGQSPNDAVLVVVFLRGGMDGLSVLVPADDQHLMAARPDIGIPGNQLLPLERGFGLNPALAAIHPLWGQGKLTAIPAVSTPDISRSHFQAQDCLERGGSATGAVEGWLDRTLAQMGPGTTFRAVSQGATLARSLAGMQPTLSLSSIEQFQLQGWEGVHDKTLAALATLYTGFEHPLNSAVATTFTALDTSGQLATTGYTPAAEYPDGGFAEGLKELARIIKAGVGLRVACIDIGGWDMHTGQGTIEGGDMQRMLTEFGAAMAAFATDLGPQLDNVTVVAMTEFGRRLEQNASWGTDHGHGAAVFVMGGGINGGRIHGNWPGLAPDALDQGDVAGANDYRNVLGELVERRLGVTDIGAIFPGHQYQRIGFLT